MVILKRMNISRQGLELAFGGARLEIGPFRHRRRFQRRVVSDAVYERLRAGVDLLVGAMRLRGHSLLAQSYYGLLVAESFERVVDRFFSNQFLAARHGLGFLRERRGGCWFGLASVASRLPAVRR